MHSKAKRVHMGNYGKRQRFMYGTWTLDRIPLHMKCCDGPQALRHGLKGIK